VAAVEVRNLRKTYGHIVAVDDLSSTIDHGEVFALLGPNGAGKSTAVRSLVFGFFWSFCYMLWPTQRTRRSAARRR
jgi:ABC-type Fe3+/spermidine/putrescine transport system ATPase subunit